MMSTSPKERQILGVEFFIGDVSEVIAKIETGGCLWCLSRHPSWRLFEIRNIEILS